MPTWMQLCAPSLPFKQLTPTRSSGVLQDLEADAKNRAAQAGDGAHQLPPQQGGAHEGHHRVLLNRQR